MDYEEVDMQSVREELKALHRKPGLSLRVRYLASIEALTALGNEHGLHLVFDLALDEGVSLVEVHEVLLQATIFCGFPRTINAFTVLRRCLRKRGESLDAALPPSLDERTPGAMKEEGYDLFCRIHYHNHGEVLEELGESHPELPQWVIRAVYGKVLSRPSLDPKTRELAAVAALTVAEVYPQLLSHIKGGLNFGADRKEVREVIRQMEAYTSLDTVRKALRILNLGTRNHETPVQWPLREAR